MDPLRGILVSALGSWVEERDPWRTAHCPGARARNSASQIAVTTDRAAVVGGADWRSTGNYRLFFVAYFADA